MQRPLHQEIFRTRFGRFQAEPNFTLDNLTILSGPHRSSTFNYVDGSTSRSLRPVAPPLIVPPETLLI